jgi:hypothetical protein
MFDALILVELMVIAAVGGKASLIFLASQPLIGRWPHGTWDTSVRLTAIPSPI